MIEDPRAVAVIQAEELRAARTVRTDQVATSPGAAQGRLATVVEIVDTKRLRISVDGTIVPATIDRSLGAVRTGDTVDAVHTGGAWQVVRIITWHEPEPVLTAADLPPKPNVTVPASPSSPGSVPTISLQTVNLLPTVASLSDAQYEIRETRGWLNLNIRNLLAAVLNEDWRPVVNAAGSTAVNAGNAVRTVAQQVGGAGGVTDYAQSVGTAATQVGASVAGAAVESGTARRVQDVTLTDMPENIDRAGYETWDLATQAQAGRILAWRIQAFHTLRDAVNRARAFRNMSGVAAFPAAPTTLLDDTTWSAAQSIIQAVDDWASARITTLISAVNTFRANEALPAATYSGGVTAWSGGAYTAARPGLIVSMRNYRIRATEMRSALQEPINILNGRG